MSRQAAATQKREQSWELFISRFAEMFIRKQRGKVEWFDLISKSKCISKTETILQLVVISCADDSGWQCRVTDVLPGPGLDREGTLPL